MTPGEVDVDPELVARAAAVAAARGETLEEVIERMLRTYASSAQGEPSER